MLKIVVAGATALFISAAPLAYAQTPSAAATERLSIAASNTLTDLRIDLVKALERLGCELVRHGARLVSQPTNWCVAASAPDIVRSKSPWPFAFSGCWKTPTNDRICLAVPGVIRCAA